jgi:asparagine synthase (glutamine-hydrolysing)
MDSSSIAATAALLLKQSGQPFDLRAYTIVFERLIPDEEGKYARLTAEQYQLPITYLVAENYIGQPLPEKPVYLSPEPFALPGQTAEEDQKRRASAHSRVMLAGYGGDPLFGPAPSYLWGLLARGQVTAWGRAVAAHWRIHHRRPPLYIRHWLNYRRLPAELRLPVWLKADFVARQCLAERFRDIWLQNQAEDNRASMSESPFWSNLFGRADPGFTGVPLKFRFPFFDQRLVEFILTVPPVPWFTDKHLLRAAISNRISLTVLQRPKTPLASQPHGQQARQVGSPEWMKKLAGEGGLEPYVNREQLAQLVAEPGRLKPWQYSQLYLPITFAYWLKQGDLL